MNDANLIDSLSLLGAIIREFWGLILIWGAALLLIRLPDFLKNRRLAASGIADIDLMDGRTFEERLRLLFLHHGYKVEVTPYRGDWGADLIVVKDGIRTVVQAKRYKKGVGVRAVQEAVAAKAKYRCSRAMVVTNATFTRQAKDLATANSVLLWDREALVERLLIT